MLSSPNESGSASRTDLSTEDASNNGSTAGMGAHNMSLNLGPTTAAPKKGTGSTGGGFSLSSVLGTGPKVPMGQDLLHVRLISHYLFLVGDSCHYSCECMAS